MSAGVYIGIDLGTSGCRAVAIDAERQPLAATQRPLPVPPLRAHRCEQAPELWWRAVVACLGQLAERIDPRQVRAMAIDGTSSTLLLSDADGRPLTPALMYNDSRARAQAEIIARIAPADSPARGASSSLAKLLHLLQQLPQQEQHRAAHALHQADWVMGRMCDRFGISDENNCLKLGYDPQQRRWPHWIRELPIPPRLLPEVVIPAMTVGTLSSHALLQQGYPRHTRIVAGTTDSTAAFIATGASRAGDAVTSLGSTMVLKVISEHPVNAPESGVYSHRLGDLWLAGGASNSGGAVLRKYFSQAQLDAMTPQLDPRHPTGLEYYPLPAVGERFPVSDPDKPPLLQPRPADDVQFFQAMLEGISRIEQQGYRLLQKLGAPPPTSVLTTGGGAGNPAWREIREGILGVPVVTASHQDAAYGSALLALKGMRG